MSEAFPEPAPGADASAAAGVAGPGPRPSLAARLAERSRQRALRAERLARLRPAAAPVAPAAADEAETALQEFLRALTGDLPVEAADPAPTETGPVAAPAEVLAFQRPEARAEEVVSDLGSLPGVGPNLLWALERAGIACLADLVPLAPAELASRLGPIGRLVPAAGWIAVARAGVAPG